MEKYNYTKNSKPAYCRIVLDGLGRECFYHQGHNWAWIDKNGNHYYPWANEPEDDKYTLKNYLCFTDEKGEYIRDYRNLLIPIAPKKWRFKDGENNSTAVVFC